MCGICGVFYFDPRRVPDPERVRAMCSVLNHRGPDGDGLEVLGSAALGHRRLSIIDLEHGAQPMFNEDRTVAIVFNGEIYNFRELRRRLEQHGHRFSTDHSDTETIIHLYEEKGERCVEDLRGMFAFAIWDSRRRRLVLARDRAGKKPLYYAVADGALWFASELKALLTIPEIRRTLNPRAVDLYLTHQYVPAPETIYREIKKLPQAHCMTVGADGAVHTERYWQVNYEPKLDIAESNAVHEAEAIVDEAVRLRLESDVPLGCFLSGGIDSSIIVALMRRHVAGTLRTFSIGFEEEEFNELPYARQVAERYETEHHEFTVKEDAAAVFGDLVWYFDEPYADMSAVPTYYLAKMTRQFVTVALNGDGGDESFAGYSRYHELPVVRRWWRIPSLVRRGLIGPGARILSAFAPHNPWLQDVRWVNALSLADPARRYVQSLMIFPDELKASLYTPAFAAQLPGESALEWMIGHYRRTELRTDIDRKLNTDVETYLPGDLLPKVDRTTMAFGLEGRSPFLDHHVMEFAARLPESVKFPAGHLKHLLKEMAKPLLPKGLIERKKHGFACPVGVWFRRDLKNLIHDALLSDRAASRSLFKPRVLKRMVSDHAAGRRDHSHRIWALLSLELWFRTFEDRTDLTSGPIRTD